MKRGLQKEPPFCVVNILESRPTRPAQGPSAEGPGSPDGLRCASRGDQSPHVPPCPPGELGGKGSFHLLGPKAGKVSVPPFQRGAGSRGSAPAAFRRRRNSFRRELFSLLLSFCDRKRKKEAFRPAPRAAPWTRGGGSFGDKRRTAVWS